MKRQLTYTFNRLTGKKPDEALMTAIKTGDKVLLKKALAQGANPDKTSLLRRWKFTPTPFFAALCEKSGDKDFDFIEIMLQNGANPNQIDYSYAKPGNEYTPMRYAAFRDLHDLATLLKKYGGDVDASIDKKTIITPLAVEVLQGSDIWDYRTIRNMIAWGSDVNKACFKEKLTPLQLKAEQFGHILKSPFFAVFGNRSYAETLQGTKAIMQILIEAGANPLVVDKKTGKTPLATLSDALANAKSLIAMDLDKKQADDPAFQQAADEIIQLLTKAEADWKTKQDPFPPTPKRGFQP